MGYEFDIPLICFIFLLFLTIIYFLKPRIKLSENKYYEIILICSLIMALINTCIHSLASFNSIDIINNNYLNLFHSANIILTTLFVIISESLLAYMLTISYKGLEKKQKIMLKIGLILTSLFVILIFKTDINIYKIGNITNVSGNMIDISFIFIAIFMFLAFIVAVINVKKMDKRYIAIYFIIALIVFSYFIIMLMPGILFYDIAVALLCYVMYHTIENPDVKMLEVIQSEKNKADKANRAKTDFLSSMSHEIRTPLNAIVGFSEFIKTSSSLEEAKENAEDIITSSNTLLEIVNGILDISKIEAGKLELVNTDYDVKKLLKEVKKLTEVRIGEKDIKLNFDICEDLPNVLYGDYFNTKKILVNLLTNAVKYTKEGYINFSVKCATKGNICRMFITIKDSGRGIKKEDLPKLFGKFQRLDEDKNTTTEGTGLGLAITKKLIEMMNGNIQVTSTYGKGSEFIVSIDQRVSLKKEIIEDKKEIINDNIDLSHKKVLIVDDNEINIKVASKLLQKYNLNVEAVTSGMDCIDKIKSNNNYDLILMDDMMPNMNGKETLLKLKEDSNFKIPVVILTANAINGMREEYIAKGFNDYLSKPIEKNELNRVINKFLNTSKSVLIVDDNRINLTVAKKLLDSYDFKIDVCLSGKECLSLVDKKKYDVIFMDIMMPEMDGVQTLKKLKDKNYGGVIIALTADNACNARERYLKEGFDEYISKPSNKKVIKETIDKFFNI